MGIRLSGMISGLDTDSIVKELVSAYSTKKDKYVKSQTKLEWKMDAWKSLNTKVYDFYTSKLSNLRLSSTYNKKAVTVSDTSKAKVSASSSAVNGTQRLAIKQLSKSGYLTGAKLGNTSDGNKVTGSTTLSQLGVSGDTNINVAVDGTSKTVGLSGDMTINQFVANLKDAGLNASFDEAQQRFYISSKTSGEEHDFSLTGDANGVSALKSLGIFSMSKQDVSSYEKWAGYSDSSLELMALNEYLDKTISTKNKSLTEQNTSLTNENNSLNSQNNNYKNYNNYAGKTAEQKVSARESLQKDITKAAEAYEKKVIEINDNDTLTAEDKDKQKEEARATLDAYQDAMEEYNRIDAQTGFSAEYTDGKWEVTGEANSAAIENYVNTNKAKIDANSEVIKANSEEITANKAKINENTEVMNKTYKSREDILALQYNAGDEENEDMVNWVSDFENDETYQSIKAKFDKISSDAANILSQFNDNVDLGVSNAVRIEGQDSIIQLNGVEYQSNTDNYSINGLTITATGTTAMNEAGEYTEFIDVTTNTDVDGIYNMIKDFFKSYNELIKEMDSLFNSSTSKGYEPLTDEEKDEMSETEIEKWEKKIKDSLLSKDDTLSSVISSMKTNMSKSYTVGDKSYSLASFGISTLSYFSSATNEKGVYHIDGDSEDSSTSGKTDKLRAAIANDPESIVQFFSQLTAGVYEELTKKMASSTVSSAFTLYNDKSMQSQYNDYKKTISKWEDKITAYEEKYYNQFTAMEKALSSLQSQTSSLTNLFS